MKMITFVLRKSKVVQFLKSLLHQVLVNCSRPQSLDTGDNRVLWVPYRVVGVLDCCIIQLVMGQWPNMRGS